MNRENRYSLEHDEALVYPEVIKALGYFEVFHNMRFSTERISGLQLTVDQLAVLAQVGLASATSEDEADRVIRDLRRTRSRVVCNLFYAKLLAGGTRVGEPFGLTPAGQEKAVVAIELIKQELACRPMHDNTAHPEIETHY